MRVVLAVVACVALAPLPRLAQEPRLAITYLANMGVLLESGGKRIVIDGFHHAALEGTAAVPPALLSALEHSRAPLDRIDLVLTTHRHLDHFDAGSVARRLSSDSSVVFVAAQETVDSLHANTGLRARGSQVSGRVRGVVPPSRGETRVPVAGIDLTVLDLPHNPTRRRRVANVGFLIDFGGMRALHVGDADPTEANFASHRLSQRSIDVAFVPFWYLTERNGEMMRTIGARMWIATHLPASGTLEIARRVREAAPGALVLTSPGERLSVR
jgi:L-ascorbate metabolism protein UlaG (beta-lactamase superfamily)